MEESYQKPDEFKTTAFLLFCLDEKGDIAFKASWGSTIEDVRKFAILISKITNNELTAELLSQLKQLSLSEKDGKKKYSLLRKTLYQKNQDTLAVHPMEVEIV